MRQKYVGLGRLHIHVNRTWYVFGGMGYHSRYLVHLQQSKKVHVGLIGRTS